MTLDLVPFSEGVYRFSDGEGHEYLQFDLGKGKLLMLYVNGIPSPLGEGVPTFWSTAPTRITTGLGVAVNAKFDLDTGRSFPHGADVSETNRDLIKSLSEGLYKVLTNLLCCSRFSGKVLCDDEDGYSFFCGLWTVFCNLRNAGKWSGGETGVSFLRGIVWGGDEYVSGYGRFVRENAVVPSGLPGPWRKLYALNEISYIIPAGMMNAELCFQALRLLRTHEGAVSDQMLGAVNSALLHVKGISRLDWRKVLEVILEVHAQLTPNVVNGALGKALADAAARDDLPMESDLRDLLRRFLFASRSGEYHPAKGLLCAEGYNRKDDEAVERLKIAFAPDDCVLSDDYNDVGRAVYRLCRSVDREGIEQDRLAEIASKSVLHDRDRFLKSVLEYVCISGCGTVFCEKFRDLCGETWCKDLLADPIFLGFCDTDKMTIAGQLRLPVKWEPVTEPSPKQGELDLGQPDPKDDLIERVASADKYSHGWMRGCIDLEILESGVAPGDNVAADDHEDVTIVFGRIEKTPGFRNTFVLSHANRPIPGWFREEQNQPLDLCLQNGERILTVIEHMAVEQDRIVARVKVTRQMHEAFPNDDYSSVVSVKTSATRPGFLLEALRQRYRDFQLADNRPLMNDISPNVKLIYGPPGTGKTEALVRDEICRRILDGSAKTILVLTPTNKAADVVAERIKAVCEERGVLCPWLSRFGLSASADLQAAAIARGKDVAFGEGNTLVVVTTVMRLPYDKMRFPNGSVIELCKFGWDCVMFDEASMIPLMYMAYPLHLFNGKPIIIAGDPNQIEPVVKSGESYGKNVYTMLKLPSFGVLAEIEGSSEESGVVLNEPSVSVRCLMRQHRSKSPIGEVFSRFCYDGKLTHMRDGEPLEALKINGLPDVRPLTVLRFPVERTEGVYKVGMVNRSSYHVYSVLFVFEYIRKLAGGFDLSQYDESHPYRIGVVSPYRIQADMINRLLARAEFPAALDIQAQTVHGFQGDECELVIAMLNPPSGMGKDWSVGGEVRKSAINNRHILNVAISRARDHLIVALPLASPHTRNYDRLVGPIDIVRKMEAVGIQYPGTFGEYSMRDWEDQIWGPGEYIRHCTYLTGHQSVNVYTQPENRFEVRSEAAAIDIQFKDDCLPSRSIEHGPIDGGDKCDPALDESGVDPVEEAREKFQVPKGYHKPQPNESYVRSGKAYYQFSEDSGKVEKLVCEEESGDFPMDLIFAIEGVVKGSCEV